MPTLDDAMANPLRPVTGSAPVPPRSPASLADAWHVLFAVFLSLVTIAAFWPILFNDFVNWDDVVLIVENPHIRSLSRSEILWMFSTFYLGPYQPLPWLSYAIDFSLWGLDPRGYHLVNLIWHVLTVLVFYLVARRIMRQLPGETKGPPVRLEICAALSAVLFAVHPLRVESVAWASERRDVLAGFFALCTVWMYLKAVQSSPTKRASMTWMGASLLCFALSLLSKATAVALPALLTVLDYYPLRRLAWDRSLFAKEGRGVWREKLPFWALSILGAAAALYGQHSAGAMAPLESYSMIDRLMIACFGLAFYVWKTVIPVHLSPIYEIPYPFHPWEAKYLLPALISSAVLTWLACYRRRLPALAVAAACYVLLLAPVSGVALTGGQLAADRYTYLPCLGFAVLLGGTVLRLAPLERSGTRRRGALGSGLLVPILLLVISSATLGVATWKQTKVWRNTETLWRHALAVHPSSSIALNNLGRALVENGSLEQAQSLLLRVLNNHPQNADAHNNMGIVLRRLEQPYEAFRHYMQTMELRPRSVDTAYNIGLLFTEEALLNELEFSSLEEQWLAAAGWYQKALAIKPDHAKALNGLGIIQKRLGRLDQAMACYGRALRVNPYYFDAEYNLAIALSEQGNEQESLVHYKKVLSLQPAHAGAANNLALLLERQGLCSEAGRILRAGLEHAPEHRTLLHHLSWLLATSPNAGCRNGNDALTMAKRLMRVVAAPAPEVLDTLAAAYAETGQFPEAIKTSTLAAQLAREQEKPNLASQIDERIQMYQSGMPFHAPPTE